MEYSKRNNCKTCSYCRESLTSDEWSCSKGKKPKVMNPEVLLKNNESSNPEDCFCDESSCGSSTSYVPP